MKSATATAHSNIALVKYWGKRFDTPPELNLPAVGSLSMTLDALWTQTEVGAAPGDAFELDGAAGTPEAARKVFAHLDRMWRAAGRSGPRPACAVVSENHLPTAGGLASSASGFAALTVAAAAAFEADLDQARLSALARMGSGSAARSIFGGFVRLDRGERPDGSDCVARPLPDIGDWPLRLMVIHTTRQRKPIGSTEGMVACAETSPYYAPWVDTASADLDAAQAALASREFAELGAVVEHSCFKMHAAMLATRPPLLYWNGATVDAIQSVWAARRAGVQAYVTIDAGPHVKVLIDAGDVEALRARVEGRPGVEDITVCAPGPAAHVTRPRGPQ